MQDKIVYRQSQFFKKKKSSVCFFDIISGFGKILLSLILSGTSKSCVFEKIYTSVFSIGTPKVLRMQGHLDFGCATVLDEFPCR